MLGGIILKWLFRLYRRGRLMEYLLCTRRPFIPFPGLWKPRKTAA
jgi:hypothetical protein